MNVLLTHAYVLADDPRERRVMKPYPPLGILGIAAYLRDAGYAPEVFDTTFSTIDNLVAQLRSDPPDLLGIYTNMMTRPVIVELIARIREDASTSGIRIVLGGPEVTAHVDRFLESGADVIVIGEGEETTLDLVRTFEEEGDLENVAGIAWRDSDGTTHRAPARPLIKPIDRLPSPARDLIDIDRYLSVWREHHGAGAISVSTMRGCPFSCRWCSRAVYGSSYRRRSPAVVCDELEEIIEEWNPETLWFVDDVFTISPKWMRGFAAEIAERGLKIRYECISRADRLNDEMIDLLAESGCFRVWIGAESGSQKILDAMDRRVEVEQVRKMMLKSRERGLETGTFIMLGYPGETIEDIEETAEHLKACRPHHYTVTTAYPIAGTPLYDLVADRLTVHPPWEASTDRDLRFERTYPEEFYRHALRWLDAEVRLDRMIREGGRGIERLKATARSLISRRMMRRIARV